MRSFHVILTDNSERDITAKAFDIGRAGELTFVNQNGETIVAYGSGQWLLVEVETRDDKGEGKGDGRDKG